MNFTSIILAGGQSSRMGKDKALLEFHGKPLVQYVSETMKQVFVRRMSTLNTIVPTDKQ